MIALNPIHLLIAEDDPVLRDALALYLSLEDDIDVVGEAADAAQAKQLAQMLQPDVLLMDLHLQQTKMVAFIRAMCHETPDTQIVFLLTEFDRPTIDAALQAGAAKYALKGLLASELVKVIRQVSPRHAEFHE